MSYSYKFFNAQNCILFKLRFHFLSEKALGTKFPRVYFLMKFLSQILSQISAFDSYKIYSCIKKCGKTLFAYNISPSQAQPLIIPLF